MIHPMRRLMAILTESDDPADAFEDAFWQQYEASPWKAVSRISLHKHEPDVVEISHIAVNQVQRGGGIGNRLLQFLTALADYHGVVLLAGPATDADGEEGLDTAGLADWYGRWGFEWDRGIMRREPEGADDVADADPHRAGGVQYG